MQDAHSLAFSIASGRTSAPEVMSATLEAVRVHAGLGVAVLLDPGRAMMNAHQAGTGPFSGVPFLGKDLGAGSAAFPPGAGVEAVRRKTALATDSLLFTCFRDMGLVEAGLSTVPPFGLALTSDPARNPFNPALSPGGSSGGAAAAVAAGIVAIAHATDAAGSIRVPAACCGLFGLKPSRGAVPGAPDFGNHLMGLASELVVARSLRDVKQAFVSVSGGVTGPGFAAPARIALTIPGRCNGTQAHVTDAAAAALAGLGFSVATRPAPDGLGHRAAAAARTILTAALAEWVDALDLCDGDIPAIAGAIAAEGRAMPAATLFAASRDMARIAHELWDQFAAFDVILSPVLADGPPAFGAFDMSATCPEAHFAQMEAIAPNAALANVAGAPALAMPFGMDQQGLPAGVQLMSRPGTDMALLALGATLAEAAPPVIYPHPIAGHP